MVAMSEVTSIAANRNPELRMPVKPQLLAPVTADGDNGGMPSELWQRLRAAREHAKLTQQQIADACGVSREAVSQWEAKDPAKRKTPGVPRLRNAGIGLRAKLCPLIARRHVVNTGLTAFNNVRRREQGKPAQPEARRLRLAVAELPRLYRLVRLPEQRGQN